MSKSKIENPKSKIDLIQTRIKNLWEDTDFALTIFQSLVGYAIIAADFDGNIIAYNKGAQQAYGYSPEEIIGKKNIETFFPKDFVETGKFQQVIDDLLGKETVSLEGEKLRKNGKRFPAQMLFTLTKDRNGKVVGFVEIVEDFTKRKQAEEALRASEERFRTISVSAQDAIIMMDDGGNISFWNEAAERIFGHSEEEVLGKELHHFLAPERCHEAYRKGFSEFKGTGQGPAVGKTLELEAVRRNGDEFPIELSVSGVRVKGKWNAVGIVRDISDRKRLEKELSASRLGFINIVEKNQEGVLVVEKNGLISYVNPAACVSFRRKAESLKGNPFGRALVSDQIAEIEIFRPNGEPGIAEMRVVESEWEHRPAYLVMLTDITERTRAEKRLHKYADELQQSNEEIRQFAYIVSHDLRAPLVNLKGFAAELQSACHVLDDTMAEALSSLDDAQKREVIRVLKEDIPEALSFINSSVTRMDGYVSAILKLSRLGRRELNMGQVDMEGIVGETLRTLAHQIEERNVKVTTGSLPGVIADRTSMEQVTGNLLTNALLYLDPERPGEIEIMGDGNPDEAIFHVRDNGRGISKKDMHKIFAPFRRAGKEDVPGEGMGLAYVQTLIKRHGGRIWVESELGKGATFSFSIPKKPSTF